MLGLLLASSLAPADAKADRLEPLAKDRDSLTWSVEAILADPSRIDLYDHRFIAFSRENRDRLVPGLKAKAPAAAPAVRLLISQLLLQLGEEDASALLLEGLESRSREDQHGTLVALSLLPYELGRGLTVPLEEERALEALLPFLDHDDPRFRSLAADALFRLSIPAAFDRQKALLTHRDPALRKKAAMERASRYQDPAAWPILRRALADVAPGEAHERHFLLLGLVDLCGSESPALRKEVVAAAAAEVERRWNMSDNGTANEVWNLLRCFETARTPLETKVLEGVLASNIKSWVRGVALKRVSEIEGEAGIARLDAALDDVTLRAAALSALRDRRRESATPELVDRVRLIFEEAGDQGIRALAYDALVTLGGGQDPAIRRYLARLDPVRRFEASARLRGISAEEMLQALAAAALVPGTSNDAAETFVEAWDTDSKWSAVLGLLHENRRLEGFDTEDDAVPPNYVSLLHGFAEIAKPDIVLSKIAMRPQAEEGKHRLSLLMDGRALEFPVADYGDWFDVTGLLAGLNDGLAAGGSDRRFVALYDAGQFAFVTFGDGPRIQGLARDHAFPVAADPDGSMRAGQEYERQVIEQLEGQD